MKGKLIAVRIIEMQIRRCWATRDIRAHRYCNRNHTRNWRGARRHLVYTPHISFGELSTFRFLCITTCFLPVFEVLPIFCLTNSCFYTFFQGCIIGNDVVFALATSVGTRRSTLRTRSHLRSVTRPRIRATEFHSYYRYSWLAGRSFAGVGFRSC